MLCNFIRRPIRIACSSCIYRIGFCVLSRVCYYLLCSFISGLGARNIYIYILCVLFLYTFSTYTFCA